MFYSFSELPPSPGVGSTLLIYSYFTFLESVKAILVHCAHRLLSKLARILFTLRNRPGGRQTQRLHQIAILATQAGSPRAAKAGCPCSIAHRGDHRSSLPYADFLRIMKSR